MNFISRPFCLNWFLQHKVQSYKEMRKMEKRETNQKKNKDRIQTFEDKMKRTLTK